jgi:N-acetyl-gamma-glutamyl-phosphate reductase
LRIIIQNSHSRTEPRAELRIWRDPVEDSMGARVAVAGASGYAGGELLRLLAAHPDLELAAVTADSSAGKTVGEVHPHLAGAPALAGLTLQPHEPDLLGATDLVFLALPAGQSAVTAAQIPGTTKVVDLGPDFRLADGAAWARHYSGPHPGRWVTGIPELAGARPLPAATRRRRSSRWRRSSLPGSPARPAS